MAGGVIEIRPQEKQEVFLSTSADFALFGGAAGGGKTHSLLLEPLRHIRNPYFGAVFFRRTSPQIIAEGGLWSESEKLYPLLGAIPKQSPPMQWDFPSGATITMTHMQHDNNRFDWQGSQVPLFLWDELTHFSRRQFFYMFSRNRSTCGVRPYIRATCNPVPPDDKIGGWVHEFVGWYIGGDGYAIPERSGVIRWFASVNDELRWADTAAELIAKYPDCEPKSFTFIRSDVYDNKILLAQDPGYLANLKALPLYEQEQLLKGNWLVKPAAGKIFNRDWFEIVDAVPAGGWTVRFWDLAASEKKVAGDDPDFTASTKMKYVNGLYFVLDCTEERMEPARTDTSIKNTATQDGKDVFVRFEMEGGASGKRDARYVVTMLDGYDIKGVRPQGDKITRAKGLAAQALAGNVKLLRGSWNQRWLNHMHGQPDLAHDDLCDSSSGAYNELQKISKLWTPGSARANDGN
jgi:predicted phage terminase large subunit-like protein